MPFQPRVRRDAQRVLPVDPGPLVTPLPPRPGNPLSRPPYDARVTEAKPCRLVHGADAAAGHSMGDCPPATAGGPPALWPREPGGNASAPRAPPVPMRRRPRMRVHVPQRARLRSRSAASGIVERTLVHLRRSLEVTCGAGSDVADREFLEVVVGGHVGQRERSGTKSGTKPGCGGRGRCRSARF